MWNDFRLLLHYQLLRIWRDVKVGLRFIGFEPNDSLLNYIYVGGFWVFWLFMMWAYILDVSYRQSQELSYILPDMSILSDFIPILIFTLQLMLIIRQMFITPLKVSAPDLQHIVVSSVHQGSLALVSFLSRWFLPVLLQSGFATIFAMQLAWAMDAPATLIGVQIFILTNILGYVSGLMAWGVGIIKHNLASPPQRWLIWIGIIISLVGLYYVRDMVLFMGRIWYSVVLQDVDNIQLIVFSIFSILMITSLLYLAQKVSADRIISDSKVYARISRFGFWGRFYAQDIIRDIRQNASISHKFPTYLRSPNFAQNPLRAMNYLMLVRLSPKWIGGLLFFGMLLGGLTLGTFSAGDYRDIETWVVFALVLSRLSPQDITRSYFALQQKQFMRQFLSSGRLNLMFTQTLLPFLIALLPVLVIVSFQSSVSIVHALSLSLGGMLLVTLCHLISSIRLPIILRYVRYEVNVLVVVSILAIVMFLLPSLAIAILVVWGLNIVLLSILFYGDQQKIPLY
ncbi:MAG: hypothetical protein AAF846_27000 [Chloroflexota bacterium]